MLREFEKISPTAFNQAYMRTFYGIPYALEVANILHAEDERIKIYGVKMHRHIENIPLFEARYKGGEAAISEFILKNPNSNVLELAAGFSLHGLFLSQKYPNIKYIETDLPHIILAKTDLIQNKLGIKNIQNLYFSPASALDFKALLEALKFADLKNPLAVYCEGFLDYLSLEEKTQAVYNIKKILSKYGGVFITPDPSASIARRADQYTFLPRYRESIKKVEITTGQNYDDYAFKDEQDADMLFQSNQWTED